MNIVRLLSPEPVGWLQHHQLYSAVGADIVMESIALIGRVGGRLRSERYTAKSGRRAKSGTCSNGCARQLKGFAAPTLLSPDPERQIRSGAEGCCQDPQGRPIPVHNDIDSSKTTHQRTETDLPPVLFLQKAADLKLRMKTIPAKKTGKQSIAVAKRPSARSRVGTSLPSGKQAAARETKIPT